jgi:hypothetical protein
MRSGNPFGIEDDGKTAGMLSYFFVLPFIKMIKQA